MEFIKKRAASDAGQLSTELKNASLWKNETACTELGDRSAITRPRTVSHYLHVRDFKFSISNEDTIRGIEVRIHRKGKGISDYYVGLIYPDGQNLTISDNLSNPGFWTNSESIVSYGGSNELWGTNLTPEQVNDPEFGVGISVQDNSKSNTAYIDYVEMMVHVEAGVLSGGITLSGESPSGKLKPVICGGGIVVDGHSENSVVADVSGGSKHGGKADVKMIHNPKTDDKSIIHKSKFGVVLADFSLHKNIFSWDIRHSIENVQEVQTRSKINNQIGLLIGRISRQVKSPILASALLEQDQISDLKNEKWFLRIRPAGDLGRMGLDKWGPERGIKMPVTIFPELKSTGTASVSNSESRLSQGGLCVSGESSVHKVIDLSGGIKVGALNDQNVIFNMFGNGGIRTSPNALNTGPIHEKTEGGVSVFGRSHISVPQERITSGGVSISGQSVHEHSYHGVPQMSISGNCLIDQTFNPKTVGGTKASPESKVTPYSPNVGGGIVVDGESRITPYRNVSEGGIGCGGESTNTVVYNMNVSNRMDEKFVVDKNLIGKFVLKKSQLSWSIEHKMFKMNAINIRNSQGVICVYVGAQSGKKSPIVGNIGLSKEIREDFWNQKLSLFVDYNDDNFDNRTTVQKIKTFVGPEIGGSAIESKVYCPQGGCSLNGSASISKIHAETETVQLNRTLRLQTTETKSVMYQPSVSGGSEIGGTSGVQYICNPEIVGNNKLSPESNHNVRYELDVLGGISAGASSVIQIAPTIGGGIIVSGNKTIPQQIFNPSVVGGVSLGGCVRMQQIYEAYRPGRSIIRSLSLNMVSALSTYSESPIGGTFLLGRAKVELLKNHQPSKRSMLGSMFSDHIFKEPENELTAEMKDAPVGLRYENLPKWCEVNGDCQNDSAALPAIIVERQKPHVPLKDRGKAIRNRGVARVS